MTGVIGILEIREVARDLLGRQHPLVDQHLCRKRTNIKQECFLQIAATQLVAATLANHEELAVQILLANPVSSTDKEHLHGRLGRPGRRTDVSPIRIDRHIPPPQQDLPLFLNHPVDRLLASRSFGFIFRQEHQSDAVTATIRECHTQVITGDPFEELVGQGGQNPRSITGIRFATASTPMNHVVQHVQRIVDNLTRPLPLDVGHKAHPTAVVFVGRIVQPVLFGTTIAEHSCLATRCHDC